MIAVFEIEDKTGRKIRLTKSQWKHINKKHPEVENIENLQETIKNPDKITNSPVDETIYYYYKFYKQRQKPNKFLLAIVKYLNNEGFVVTAYYEDKIK
ncbi:MAG: PBECR2 nuclease fold domain-containing protein [Nanoarchaeota archaeon]